MSDPSDFRSRAIEALRESRSPEHKPIVLALIALVDATDRLTEALAPKSTSINVDLGGPLPAPTECWRRSPSGYLCTNPEGHDGKHEARLAVDEPPVESW